jgi:hypothetical protein
MRKHFLALFGGIFALVGTVCLVLGIGFFLSTRQFLKAALETQGTIAELEYRRAAGERSGSYYPTFTFRDRNERQITVASSSGGSPPSYSVGQKVTVLYDPRNSHHARIKSFTDLWLLPLILGVLGLVFAVIGYAALFVAVGKARTRKWLLSQGTAIEAAFQEVALDTSTRVNGQSPFVIWAQWHNPADARVYTFKSDAVWFDPTAYVPRERPIRVYIDPRNPKHYCVDTSFLPEAGN